MIPGITSLPFFSSPATICHKVTKKFEKHWSRQYLSTWVNLYKAILCVLFTCIYMAVRVILKFICVPDNGWYVVFRQLRRHRRAENLSSLTEILWNFLDWTIIIYPAAGVLGMEPGSLKGTAHSIHCAWMQHKIYLKSTNEMEGWKQLKKWYRLKEKKSLFHCCLCFFKLRVFMLKYVRGKPVSEFLQLFQIFWIQQLVLTK